MENVSNEEIEVAALDDWRKLAQRLHARYRASYADEAAQFVAEIMQLRRADTHLEVRLFGPVIDLAVCTRVEGRWITRVDLDLASEITDIAEENELQSEPADVVQLELALDTAHQDLVGPFWSALLTGGADNMIYNTIFDPTDRLPSLWFQRTDDHEPPRQRWHFDLWLAPEAAEVRIAAAVAAGGTVVDDSNAPSFTVLADPDGNRVCICTSQERG